MLAAYQPDAIVNLFILTIKIKRACRKATEKTNLLFLSFSKLYYLVKAFVHKTLHMRCWYKQALNYLLGMQFKPLLCEEN